MRQYAVKAGMLSHFGKEKKMLYAELPKNRKINKVEKQGEALMLYSDMGMHRLCPMSDEIIRITYTQKDQFSEREKPGVIAKPEEVSWSFREGEEQIELQTPCLTLRVDKNNAFYQYYDKEGKLLLKERERDSKVLEEFQSYKLDDEETIHTTQVETPDGVKEIVTDAAKVKEDKLYHTRMHFEWQDKEALYGLGQQEEGILNLRGQTVYVHQANRKIAVPLLVSSMGYGILVDTYSPMIFNDTVTGSYLYTEADDELDYYFMVGSDMNDVIREYRQLTGKAAMLPKWSFGYMQSQERYETAEEIQEIAREYRRREIGLDCLVLDWCSWEDGMWGQKTFDATRFPNPKEMIDKLHDQDIHFMLSIWPVMNKSTENYREMKEAGALLPASEIYNALDEKARKLYWEQVKRGLYYHGIDAWWCDSSEPITVEWTHRERMEPATMYAEYCQELQNHLPTWAMNAFPFYHAQTIYEGQRGESDEKRVCNLTRSAYTGQQRFGTILWSGDTAASWQTLRDQIASGLNFTASGLPYWTVDIGAFFVKKSTFWYWDGDYEDTVKDAGYLELFTRWYQWGGFLPIFRGHGTDCRRELWEYCGENKMFYDALLAANRLRYRLMPYIYSQAGRVWLKDESMMKMLAFDFADDEMVLDIKDQYMFGDSIMVCPVTEPMYFEAGNVRLEGSSYTRKVYLPKVCGWYDYWTEEYYHGGQWIETEAPIDRIPLFIKEGSILPTTEPATHVSSKDEIVWMVYAGKDSSYLLYEDAGDGYGYENGEYVCSRYTWSEEGQRLTSEDGTVVSAVVVKQS